MFPLPASPVLHQLLSQGKRGRYPKGQIIQTSDNAKNFNLVKSGFLKRYLISTDGSLGVQVVYGPGDVFPITLVFKTLFNYDIDDGPETFYYEAMTNLEIYSLDMPALIRAINKDPMLYRGLFRESGRRLESTLQGLENLSMKSSYNRVAHQLVYFARRFGEDEASGIKITAPFTHQDIANTLSVTRETVSNSMSELKKKGLIKPGRNIIIPSLEKLEAAAHE